MRSTFFRIQSSPHKRISIDVRFDCHTRQRPIPLIWHLKTCKRTVVTLINAAASHGLTNCEPGSVELIGALNIELLNFV